MIFILRVSGAATTAGTGSLAIGTSCFAGTIGRASCPFVVVSITLTGAGAAGSFAAGAAEASFVLAVDRTGASFALARAIGSFAFAVSRSVFVSGTDGIAGATGAVAVLSGIFCSLVFGSAK